MEVSQVAFANTASAAGTRIVLAAVLRVPGRPGHQLEPPLQRQHHVGLPPSSRPRARCARAGARERARHRHVGVDLAVARHVAEAAADEQADEHLAGVALLLVLVLARSGPCARLVASACPLDGFAVAGERDHQRPRLGAARGDRAALVVLGFDVVGDRRAAGRVTRGSRRCRRLGRPDPSRARGTREVPCGGRRARPCRTSGSRRR